MKTQELRENLKQSIDRLSPERLLVAADFLAYKNLDFYIVVKCIRAIVLMVRKGRSQFDLV